MEYVRVDENIMEHPKVLMIPRKDRRACVGLYVDGLTYASRGETDGFIPSGKYDAPDDAELVEHLATVGLWDECAGGWMIHDYLDWNRSASEIAEIREKRRAAGSAGGTAKAQNKQLASTLVSKNVPSDRDIDIDRKRESSAREDRSDVPVSMSDFPRCMTTDLWRVGSGPERSSAHHILAAVGAKHGIVAPAQIGALGASVCSACPDGCTGSASHVCAQKVIEKVKKAGSVKLAGKWYADDRGLK